MQQFRLPTLRLTRPPSCSMLGGLASASLSSEAGTLQGERDTSFAEKRGADLSSG